LGVRQGKAKSEITIRTYFYDVDPRSLPPLTNSWGGWGRAYLDHALPRSTGTFRSVGPFPSYGRQPNSEE